jgi:hypothetical protein
MPFVAIASGAFFLEAVLCDSGTLEGRSHFYFIKVLGLSLPLLCHAPLPPRLATATLNRNSRIQTVRVALLPWEEVNNGVRMQVLVKSMDDGPDTRCNLCGQGFVMYWARQPENEHAAMLKEVEAALQNHHANADGAAAHPEHGFLVPDWNGPVAFSGAAILGNAPHWAL